MPNWCENELVVEGKTEEVKKFLERIGFKENGNGEEPDFDFNIFIPYPQKYKDIDKVAEDMAKRERLKPIEEQNWRNIPADGFNSGGYDWCVKNWGTKWNACETTFEALESYGENKEDSMIQINFETAWAPPKPVIEAIGKEYPELSFSLRYFECGAAYNGVLIIEKGKVESDNVGSYYGHRGG